MGSLWLVCIFATSFPGSFLHFEDEVGIFGLDKGDDDIFRLNVYCVVIREFTKDYVSV